MTEPDDENPTAPPEPEEVSRPRTEGEEEVDSAGDAAEQADHPSETPAENKGLEPVDQTASLEESIEALRRERDELTDQLLRKRADFENYRKRVERDRELVRQEALARIIAGLLPVLDDIDRALSVDTADEGAILEGVELVRRDFVSALEAEGVVAVDPEGEPFDPQKHQALLHEAVPGFEEGTIVEVFRKGYFLKDRLLRPALVKVAKADEPLPESEPESVH